MYESAHVLVIRLTQNTVMPGGLYTLYILPVKVNTNCATITICQKVEYKLKLEFYIKTVKGFYLVVFSLHVFFFNSIGLSSLFPHTL